MRDESAEPESWSAKLLTGMAALLTLALLGVLTWLISSGPLPPPVAVVALPKTPAPEPVAEAPSAEAAAPLPVDKAPSAPPAFNTGRALLPAPDQDLIEKSPGGFLPIIARDGRQSWQVYARPFDLNDKRPRIGIVVGHLAVSSTDTDKAINSLPADVSLAFVPYRRRLGEWITLARTAGHEALLELPMEPADYPQQDPGPNALLTALNKEQNLERLNIMLSPVTGYIGMIGFMGSRFSASRDDFQPVLDVLRRRGLLYVDNRSTPQSTVSAIAADIKLAAVSANRVIDTDPTRAAVDKRLSELEDIARASGSALGVGQPYPVTLERLSVWAQGLEERGLVLAPVSALIGRAKDDPPPPADKSAAKPGTAAAAAPKKE
jgi:polysaccharide deacetylase 2 family uncharacterized protein YibQ